MSKNEIRIKMINLRKKMNSFDKLDYDSIIINKILNDENFINANIVGIFYPMKDEINLLELLKQPKRFVFPKIVKNKMIFIEVDEKTIWERHKFGMLEPKGLEFIGKIEYLLVPLLAFNNDKMRIGYGKGYYDKYINNYQPKYKAGVAYYFQQQQFEHDSHDEKLDIIITN